MNCGNLYSALAYDKDNRYATVLCNITYEVYCIQWESKSSPLKLFVIFHLG